MIIWNEMLISWKKYVVQAGCLMLLLLQAAIAQDTLRIGIIPYKDSVAFTQTYAPLFDYLEKQFGGVLKWESLPENELAFQLYSGKYDIGIFTPFPYLKAKLDFPELTVFASHTVEGEDDYEGCILVSAEGKIMTLRELKGKKFMFVKPTSTSGYKYPRGVFTERNFDLDGGFFEYRFSGGHQQSLDALLDKRVDGIAVDTRVVEHLNEAKRAKIRALVHYDVPYHAYVFRPGFDQAKQAKIVEIMMNAHKNPVTKTLFNNPLGIEKWHPQSDEAYNSLRRYLRIVRVKPSIGITYTIRPAALKLLEAQGDIVDILKDKSLNQLETTERFSKVLLLDTTQSPRHELRLNLNKIQDQFHYNIYLDSKLIKEGNVAPNDVVEHLPLILAHSVLLNLPIQTYLLTNGDDWFITYGQNDGIQQGRYSFEVHEADSFRLKLEKEEVLSIQALTTHFKPKSLFREGMPITVKYQPDFSSLPIAFQDSEHSELGFWDHLDNVWGVIGLVVAFISIAVGSYYSGQKKRRFRSLFNESNELLRMYLEDKQRFDSKLVAQKNKTHKFLEKGFINENQYLILTHRIEDIDRIVSKFFNNATKLSPEIEHELAEILSDGVITDKEFARILELSKRHT